ncbi:MAG: ABC transporter permease [Candidatus Aminicenantes bacterium]|jgi:ABC-2 type transport system permease protein
MSFTNKKLLRGVQGGGFLEKSPPGRRRQSFSKHVRDTLYLTWTQMLNVRTGWVWYFFLSSFIPLLTLFFMFLVLGYQIKWAIYVVTGNVVFAVVLGSLNTLAEQMGWMKQNRFFEHYAALPVSKISLITALVIRCTLFSFPAMLAVLVIGKLLFQLPIVLHPVLFLVFTLSGFALSGIGAVIGITSTNSNRANIATRVVFPILVFTAPVLIPLENLPIILRYTSVIMPTTYIANAFRAALSGDLGINFWIDMVIILLFTVASLYFVARKFDWRVD